MDEKTLENLLKECNVSLYDTQIVIENDHKIYRIFIYKKDGVSLDKCTEVTKIISPIMDLNPPVEGEYFLEVSSPGIERKLVKPKHFILSVGELVKLKTVDGKYKGELLSADEEKITIKDKSTKEEKEINYSDIISAKTYYTW